MAYTTEILKIEEVLKIILVLACRKDYWAYTAVCISIVACL